MPYSQPSNKVDPFKKLGKINDFPAIEQSETVLLECVSEPFNPGNDVTMGGLR